MISNRGIALSLGNNMVLVGSDYAFYSGDVNDDGCVDGAIEWFAEYPEYNDASVARSFAIYLNNRLR